jgi:aminoglycoside phosphotransferase (APT) family kinase protein
VTGEDTVREPEGDDADDPDIRAGIVEALAATDRYGPGFQILRQVSSGSRVNFVLRVDDTAAPTPAQLWCRATHHSIDDAFGARFTLARETTIVRRLSARGVAVPEILATSAAGRVVLQPAIDELTGASPEVRSVNIRAYMAALDAVHTLPAAALLPASEVTGIDMAQAVAAEQGAWWDLAAELAADPSVVATIERATGLRDVAPRLQRIHRHVTASPPPVHRRDVDFVHGDAGRANYLVDRAGSIWLIDWELAHAGSRLEDYAWIELRGLEQDSGVWCEQVVSRLGALGAAYPYFRIAIYFRSVVAISARIAAEPDHSFVPYLAERFRENEQLGWLSAGEPASDPTVGGPRLDAWHRWTRSLNSTGAA